MVKFIAFLSLPLLLLSGCGDSKPKTQKKTSKVVEKPFKLEQAGDFDPIASSKAKKGGSFSTWAGPFPKSLNMFLDYNSFSASIMGLFYEPLASLHSQKNIPVGHLAESWEISKDQMTYTFKIHPKAIWSDGKDITAEDIQFYYDVMMNPKNLTSIFRVDLKRFDRPEVVDAKTIRIKAKEKHWKNFWAVAGLVAFPKHIWEGKNFNKINFEFPVVSGPYQLEEVQKGRFISLKRRGDWWGLIKKYNQYKYNFDFLKFRAVENRTKVLEMFKKGDLDLLPIYTSKIWAKQTQFDAVNKNWVIRQQVYNKEPMGFQGLAINLRKKKFQDKRVRLALCYLMNRDLMNEKLMYNQYFMLNTYYPDLYDKNINPNLTTIAFDESKARALLKEAGWTVNEQGKLTKEGEIFKINFMTYNPDMRHLNMYSEALKSVGIVATIEQLSASSIRKRIDKHEFDLYWQAWGAGRLRDPENMWHSKQAMEIATSNRSGVQDPEIDKLIELQKTEESLDKRNEILKQIDQRLGDIVPYVLLWQIGFHRILYWNQFGMPTTVLDKFNREDSAMIYWWHSPEREKALKAAKAAKKELQPQPKDLFYRE